MGELITTALLCAQLYSGPIVICPECQKAGLKSKVTYHYPAVMLAIYIPPPECFWDEEGREHNHDHCWQERGRINQPWYECSNEHKWNPPVGKPHCWCGWPDSGPYVPKVDSVKTENGK